MQEAAAGHTFRHSIVRHTCNTVKSLVIEQIAACSVNQTQSHDGTPEQMLARTTSTTASRHLLTACQEAFAKSSPLFVDCSSRFARRVPSQYSIRKEEELQPAAHHTLLAEQHTRLLVGTVVLHHTRWAVHKQVVRRLVDRSRHCHRTLEKDIRRHSLPVGSLHSLQTQQQRFCESNGIHVSYQAKSPGNLPPPPPPPPPPAYG